MSCARCPPSESQRAGGDQRLEHALVAEPQVDALAEVEERRERRRPRAPAMIESMAPSPTLRIAPSPKRMRLSPTTVNL